MIRTAHGDDAPRIAEIHVFGWRAAYRGIIPDGYLFGGLSVTRRAAALAGKLESEEETYVWEDGPLPSLPGKEPASVIRGWMTIGDSRDEDADGAFELWGIYVDPLMKRTGVGRALVAFCEAEARARGKSEITLWVLRDNAPSRAFNEALGFAPDGKEQFLEGLGTTETRYRKRL